MKSLLIKSILIFSLLILSVNSISNTYAADWDSTIKTSVSIDLSAMLDECKVENEDKENEKYYCEIPKWLSLVTVLLWKIIKYFTFIAALAWVLYIVINGILYSMWWIDQALKDDSKKRITWTLIWLVILFLSWVILNLIAPWIYK
jgi:hypothetical protein